MDTQIYPVSDEVKGRALIDEAGYKEMYTRSIEDNEAFWAEQAQTASISWARHWVMSMLEPVLTPLNSMV